MLKLDEIEKTDDIILQKKSLIVESNKLLDRLEIIALNGNQCCDHMTEADTDCENLNIENSFSIKKTWLN